MQGEAGPYGGFFAGISNNGKLSIISNCDPNDSEIVTKELNADIVEDAELKVRVSPAGSSYEIILSAIDSKTGEKKGEVTRKGISSEELVGNIAVVSGYRGKNSRYWVKDLSVSGTKLESHADRALGPIFS
ncbi:MAG: hypothetical protein R6V58_04605, partial [Planctomycetota bacterium]